MSTPPLCGWCSNARLQWPDLEGAGPCAQAGVKHIVLSTLEDPAKLLPEGALPELKAHPGHVVAHFQTKAAVQVHWGSACVLGRLGVGVWGPCAVPAPDRARFGWRGRPGPCSLSARRAAPCFQRCPVHMFVKQSACRCLASHYSLMGLQRRLPGPCAHPAPCCAGAAGVSRDRAPTARAPPSGVPGGVGRALHGAAAVLLLRQLRYYRVRVGIGRVGYRVG